VKCYSCGMTWHMSWDCLERKKEGGGESHILEAYKWNFEAKDTEYGKFLMMKKVLLKPEPDIEKPV
jgi:hypothetical protein